MKLIPFKKVEKKTVAKQWVLLFENGSTIEIPAESFIKFDDSYLFFDEPIAQVKLARMSSKPIQPVAEMSSHFVIGVFAPHTVSGLMEKKAK